MTQVVGGGGKTGIFSQKPLSVICKNIISDVNEEVSQYKDAKRDLSEILHYLSNELDKILYTHQLRFEDIDNLRCTYINF